MAVWVWKGLGAVSLALAWTLLVSPAAAQVYFTGSIGGARLEVDASAPKPPDAAGQLRPPTFEEDYRALFDSIPDSGEVLGLGGIAFGVKFPAVSGGRVEVQMWQDLSDEFEGRYFGAAFYKDFGEGAYIPYVGIGAGYTGLHYVVDGIDCEEEQITGGMIAYGVKHEYAEMTDVGFEFQHYFFESASYRCQSNITGEDLSYPLESSYSGPMALLLRVTRRF